MSTDIKKLESELKATNKRARALRIDLRKAQEAKISALQSEIIEGITIALFPAGEKAKLEEKIERLQAIKEIFGKPEILETFRESALKYFPELTGKPRQENGIADSDDLPHKDDENTSETGKHSVTNFDLSQPENGHENDRETDEGTSENSGEFADEPRHENEGENGERVVIDFDENSANEASEDDTNMEFSPSNEWHENTHDWGGNHDAF